jgi:hypothetical protein
VYQTGLSEEGLWWPRRWPVQEAVLVADQCVIAAGSVEFRPRPPPHRCRHPLAGPLDRHAPTVLFGLICSKNVSEEAKHGDSSRGAQQAFVLEAFDTLANRRDYAAAQRFWSPDYIQHSAHIPPVLPLVLGRDAPAVRSRCTVIYSCYMHITTDDLGPP